jgi:excinuclease ABC subunit C
MFQDGNGKVIYVGKSKNLRNRVRTHISVTGTGAPVARVHGVEYIATETELEALILECGLIKRLRPYYNARLKDDKSYPYIKISMNEKYPSVYTTRTVKDDGAVYLGPYADAGSARRTIKILREVFPIRRCWRKMDRKSRPCLDYHIKRCSGPCTGQVNEGKYRSDAEGIIAALRGRKGEVLEELKTSMMEASGSQNYERAAILRDRIEALERTTLRQRLSSAGPGNADILGVSMSGDYACVQILFLRDGMIMEQENFVMDAMDVTRSEILSSFFKEYYSDNPVPRRIIVPLKFDDLPVIRSWFAERSGADVVISEPSGRNEESLVSMAQKNAKMTLDLEKKMMGESLKKGLQELARALDLSYLPRIIEAFDISNISGKDAVGSMVRFRWGRPNRSLYRKFRVRSPGRDDYAMMAEVVGRRLRRAIHHQQKLPDLILVDGGPGQASAAQGAVGELNLKIPVVGLAKKRERIFKPGSARPVPMGRRPAAHLLLRRIRNEAHRFAISYHRTVRDREVTRSDLDSIRGIGPKRKATLIGHFGSIDRIRRSRVEDLAVVPGISEELARSILDDLRGKRRANMP